MDRPALAQQSLLGREADRLIRLAESDYARNISLFNPRPTDIELLVDIASQEIPGLAPADTVIDVYRHNPESFWALSRIKDDRRAIDWPEGFFAVLPLTDEGAAALVSGRLDTSAPDLRYVCRQWERPAAIYFWCIYAPGVLSAGLALWANHYCSPKLEGVPVFAKAGTPAGAHLFRRLGFRAGAVWNGVRNDDFISLAPPAAPRPLRVRFGDGKTRPAYDNYAGRQCKNTDPEEISCSVVSNLDELLQAMAIRSAVYIGEQKCPFGEEWDGNDLSATHILARKGDEPIGVIRLRAFADFAKIERMCVLPSYRKSLAAFRLERASTELARAMGYKRLIGHAHANILRFWKSRGWTRIAGREPFVFSDHECVQIEKSITPHADAITFDIDPYTLIRPTGRWHAPGPLDASAARPAVNTKISAEKGEECAGKAIERKCAA